jgi:hypothetical protein
MEAANNRILAATNHHSTSGISSTPILKRPRFAFDHKTADPEEAKQAEKRPETS